MNPTTLVNYSEVIQMVLALGKADIVDRDQYNFFEHLILQVNSIKLLGVRFSSKQ